jgi:hypothetical protein
MLPGINQDDRPRDRFIPIDLDHFDKKTHAANHRRFMAVRRYDATRSREYGSGIAAVSASSVLSGGRSNDIDFGQTNELI